MGNPKTDGRMIRQGISDSNDFSSLSPESAVLFCMVLPHLNSHGKLQGGPAFIKEIVCPKVKYLTIENISSLLAEISAKTDMKWFSFDSRHWIHATHFTEHQKLDVKKIGKDLLPTYSRLTPDLLSDKVKDKDKVEVKEEAKGSPEPQPVDNSQKEKPALSEKQKQLQGIKPIYEKVKTLYPEFNIQLFFQNNIRLHPEALKHTLNTLIDSHEKGIVIENPMAWCEAIIKPENMNYNAADEDKKTLEFKRDKNPMTSLGNIMSGMLKSMPGAA